MILLFIQNKQSNLIIKEIQELNLYSKSRKLNLNKKIFMELSIQFKEEIFFNYQLNKVENIIFILNYVNQYCYQIINMMKHKNKSSMVKID